MAKDNCSTCFEIAFFWYSMKSPLYKLTQTVGEMFTNENYYFSISYVGW